MKENNAFYLEKFKHKFEKLTIVVTQKILSFSTYSVKTTQKYSKLFKISHFWQKEYKELYSNVLIPSPAKKNVRKKDYTVTAKKKKRRKLNKK